MDEFGVGGRVAAGGDLVLIIRRRSGVINIFMELRRHDDQALDGKIALRADLRSQWSALRCSRAHCDIGLFLTLM